VLAAGGADFDVVDRDSVAAGVNADPTPRVLENNALNAHVLAPFQMQEEIARALESFPVTAIEDTPARDANVAAAGVDAALDERTAGKVKRLAVAHLDDTRLVNARA